MTKDEWKKVENELQVVNFSFVRLSIDGYNVKLALKQYSQFKNAIFVYIDDTFKGEWLYKDCEERRRFYPCKKKSVLKDKDIKIFGSPDFRMTKKRIQEYKEKYAYNVYSSGWTNFNAMKKHFEANNSNISLADTI